MSLSRLFAHALTLTIVTIAGALSSGCAQGGVAPDIDGDEAVADTYRSFEDFVAVTFKEPDGVWIADGDTPFETIEQLREFYHRHVLRGGLAILTSDGADVRWSDAQKLSLTYCVSTKFGDRHSEVVEAMALATCAWEAAANVDFVHLSKHDRDCDGHQTGVVFDVRPVSSDQYLARAFFPSTSRKHRNILVDDAAFEFGDSPSVTGVLRHELGHVLGFRHEHTRPEAGVCFEDDEWRALTPYDSASVMHYPQCNGTGDWSLTLTSRDEAGAASVYGHAQGGKGGEKRDEKPD